MTTYTPQQAREMMGRALDHGTMAGVVESLADQVDAALAKLAALEGQEAVAARWPTVPGSHGYCGCVGCKPMADMEMLYLAAGAAQPVSATAPEVNTEGVYPKWVRGPSLFKDWCAEFFGPDSDEAYLAKAVLALPMMTHAAPQPPVPIAKPLPLADELRQFLNGEGPLDGAWFGDLHPTRKGKFWWREFLPPAAHGIKEST